MMMIMRHPVALFISTVIGFTIHKTQCLMIELEQGLLYRWTEHSADFFKMATGGGKKALQITPRGWIFWTMIFYNLKKFRSKSI